ncbi:histidine kinase [Kribbella flavida DSM 17836]|uniref:histidine kinase n=1 Tax=Kribbella flavida (strain DSM 17836 / JCM 10339 / NBRC 14399) TaxID=479435 RepID=D2Q508_KRIFD|nr:histidine kinase [Kribbella flavida]ADB34263.1 histidine kinase [Kribbella flavida DSM 17836]
MHDDRRRALPPLLTRSGRTLTGVTLGSLLALVEMLLAGVAVLFLLPAVAAPRSRGRLLAVLHRCAGQLAAVEQRRLARFHATGDLGPYSGRQAFGYVVRRWPLGLLGGFVLMLLLFGLLVAASMVSAWILGGSWAFIEEGEGRVSTATMATVAIPGLVLLYLAVMGIVGVAELDVRLARQHLTPSAEDVLSRRVSELTLSRKEVVQVVNEERRRIERDLHDGVQQRLVALGLLLSRARRTSDPAVAAELVRQAHEESQQALGDLRDVAWRVYPTALDQLGLRDVLAVLAERSGIPITLRYDLADRPPAPIETVAYFVVSEALTNATKHSAATRIDISLTAQSCTGDRVEPALAEDPPPRDTPGRIVVTVTDDGKGGADPGGRGLTGLAGRVAASEGTFTVDSPPGGPTTIKAELPCG